MEIKIKRDKMTKDERWLAMLNRQPLDRIPVHGFSQSFSAVHCGLTIADAYNNPEKAFQAMTKTAAKFGWQDLPIIAYASMGGWEFGGEIKWPESEFSQAPTVTRRPVESEEDIDKLKVPDVTTAGIIPLMMEVSKLQEKSGAALIECISLGPWSLACNIAGVETICKWSLKKPDLVHKLEKKVLPFSIGVIRYWKDTFGTDRVLPWVGGSAAASNQLISPKIIEHFVLPYMKEFYNEVHAMGFRHIFIHICGEQNANLPYWSQLNYGDPGIISIGHEVELEIAAKYFPNNIIMGNIEPAMLLTKNPEEVYQATKVVIEKGKKYPGGFMLAPGCEMAPRVPENNVWAMMQAVSDLGWYE
jgi:uroporphyrinogen decarboxylase